MRGERCSLSSLDLVSRPKQSAHLILTINSKHLYNLLPSSKPPALTQSPISRLCKAPDLDSRDIWSVRYEHMQACHRESWEAYCAHQRATFQPEPALKKCMSKKWYAHCECFTRRGRLHNRLRSWMPKSLNYCGVCEKFTKRKKSHNGRCE